MSRHANHVTNMPRFMPMFVQVKTPLNLPKDRSRAHKTKHIFTALHIQSACMFLVCTYTLHQQHATLHKRQLRRLPPRWRRSRTWQVCSNTAVSLSLGLILSRHCVRGIEGIIIEANGQTGLLALLAPLGVDLEHCSHTCFREGATPRVACNPVV